MILSHTASGKRFERTSRSGAYDSCCQQPIPQATGESILVEAGVFTGQMDERSPLLRSRHARAFPRTPTRVLAPLCARRPARTPKRIVFKRNFLRTTLKCYEHVQRKNCDQLPCGIRLGHVCKSRTYVFSQSTMIRSASARCSSRLCCPPSNMTNRKGCIDRSRP